MSSIYILDIEVSVSKFSKLSSIEC